MDQSPPKRITRARAAAKTEPATKTTKVVTAAARAKATRGTASTSAKRKTRSDDVEDSDNDELGAAAPKEAPPAAVKAARATRGRPKKTAEEIQPQPETEPENPAPVKTRGRPKKVAVAPPAMEPVKTTRATRTKKTVVDESEEPTAPKRTTRARPLSSMATRTAASAVVKKAVKFEEPEKENIAPAEAAAGKPLTKVSETGTGLRAKPVRRPVVAASRATRGTKTNTATGDKPIPLSPKKINQMAKSRADSDDELAPNDKLPARPLRKNPIRPPTGVKKLAHDPQPAADEEDATSGSSEAGPTIILGSPAKKLPQSPWKGSIKSPAKRVEGVLGIPSSQVPLNSESSQSPFKATLLQSPAKRPPPGTLDLGNVGGAQLSMSPFKTSLLLSPAKRPLSPMKAFAPRGPEDDCARSPAPKATMLATPLPTIQNGGVDDDEEGKDIALDDADDNMGIPDSPTRLRFPGRLSAVLPRHADPALTATMLVVPEAEENGFENDEADDTEEADDTDDEVEEVECLGDPMALDEPQNWTNDADNFGSTAAPTSPPKPAGPMFRLREEVLQSYDSETEVVSEDELAPRRTLFPAVFGAAPATPCLESTSRTPGSRPINTGTNSVNRNTAKRVRTNGKFGYTPLAEQLNGWTVGLSPLKTGIQAESPSMPLQTVLTPGVAEPSPMRTTFFDEAMVAKSENTQAGEQIEDPAVPEVESPVLEDIPLTEEDMALVAEANEMSLMEPEQVEELVGNRSFDDTVSEASQEYGDENEVPIDPSLLAGSQEPGVPLVTPRRPLHREFHTVSKVPLKPADESTPQLRVKKRSQSISRLPVSRPTQNLARNATVISYSPTKAKEEREIEATESERAGSAPPPVTPSKSEAGWSMIGTPARTPRRDIDPALLRGAVVFVDVHTSEGADASGIFVELLGQMGARCVSRWSWNPASPPGNDASASKIGITHVVYKDGGKRTLEKVKESGGVVQCVGVSWVLE